MLFLAAGCSNLHFYRQSVLGHLGVMQSARSIDKVLASTELDDSTRAKLTLVKDVRAFARNELSLSFNNSYTHYVDLERDYVLTNIVAAPEFSTALHSWCYLVIGCASYRGYFDEQQLAAEQQRLEGEGLEVYAYPVTAYSTLGWFSDPVLNTFMMLPEPRMVGLILHELAHQQIYVEGDSSFNESFATAVERTGLELFYRGGEAMLQLEQAWQVTKQINQQASQTREALESLYQESISAQEMRLHKRVLLDAFSKEYLKLTGAKSTAGKSSAVALPQFNNARLGVMATYQDFVPAFLNLLQFQAGAFKPFFERVEEIGALPKEQRDACLLFWSSVDVLTMSAVSKDCH
ncbi:MAG: aminopeptidase [Halioglobus sp.]